MSKVIQFLPKLQMVKAHYSPNPETGDQVMNLLWIANQSAGTPTSTQLLAMAAVFDPLWATMWAHVGSSSFGYIGSEWFDWSSSFGAYADSRTVFTYHGGSQGSPVPPNTSALLSLKNGERYKGGHFRTYLPWIGETAITTTSGQDLVAGLASTVAAAWQSMQTGILSSGILGGQGMVLYRHRYDPVNKRIDSVSSMVCQGHLATQRRRLRKAPHH